MAVNEVSRGEGLRLIALAMSEVELQRNAIELAERLGYLVAHVRDSRGQKVTGLPDLIICGHGRLYFWELKTQNGRVTGLQRMWIEALNLGTQVEAGVFRPQDWLDGTIERML